jgi:membrane protease YdiL (CAAX protease family)
VDVLGFMGFVAGFLWILLPMVGAGSLWNTAFTLAGVVLALLLALRKGITRQRAGLRSDNLLPAVPAYLGAALLYAGAVLFLFRSSLRPFPGEWPDPLRVGGLLLWALFQEFCLLSFMLNRLREILGRDAPAAAAAAALFALLHLPNPFLTLYTFGGGLILALLFLHRPSLPAAALAHAAASFAAGRLLPPEVTGWMRVGPLYGGMR